MDYDIVKELRQFHEWGYRDPVVGGFIECDLPFAAATEIERLRSDISLSRFHGMTPPQRAVLEELYKAIEKVTDDPNLLAIIGSWGETLGDEDTLDMLQQHNRSEDITPLTNLQ